MSNRSEVFFHNKNQMDASPEAFGKLRESEVTLDDIDLRGRMDSDGYLFFRNALDNSTVLNARRSILERLNSEGAIDQSKPLMDGVAAKHAKSSFRPELANGNPAIEQLLYAGPMMEVMKRLLNGPVRHFDYTWLRVRYPQCTISGENCATDPHCDVVYMGRGTHSLYTAWTPLGDVPQEMGGLMILENSTKKSKTMGRYWTMDVDKYCENGPDAEAIEKGEKLWDDSVQEGSYDDNAVRARQNIGGRWLTENYRAGDILVFSIFMLHASLNNTTDYVRLSTDSRYQLASDPSDERWIGHNPVGHGSDAKIGMIC